MINPSNDALYPAMSATAWRAYLWHCGGATWNQFFARTPAQVFEKCVGRRYQRAVSQDNRRRDISQHIFPTSATMVGVCVTVVGIIRLLELTANVSTIIDNVVAVDSALFLASCALSYLSLRSERHSAQLERYGDLVFVGGLVLMVVAGCMLAWELGLGPAAIVGHAG